MFFFGTELLFSKRSCSAAIASWKDFRTIAPTYFCMGNPFLIVPQVFGHSIYRFHDANYKYIFVFLIRVGAVLFCTGAFIFKMVLLCGYWELEGLPHHSSDVFFHGESISDSAASVWPLYLSISCP